MFNGKMGVQPILPITVPIKKIKGAAVNVTLTVMESLGVDGPLVSVHIELTDEYKYYAASKYKFGNNSCTFLRK